MDIKECLKIRWVYYVSTHDLSGKNGKVAGSFSTETARGRSGGWNTVRSSRSDSLLKTLMAQ